MEKSMSAGNKKAFGFTLIELLVTVAVLVVIVTLAIPNFSSLLQRNAVAVSTNALIADLSRARNAAMTNRAKVTARLNPAAGNGWSMEVRKGENSPFAGTVLLVDDQSNTTVGVSASTIASTPVIVSLPLDITFNSLGWVDGAQGYSIEFSNASDSSNVCVERSGEIHACSP